MGPSHPQSATPEPPPVHASMETRSFLPTRTPPIFFHLPNVATAPASKIAGLHHNVREPARTVEMVPELVQNTLLIASKLSYSNYISVYY